MMELTKERLQEIESVLSAGALGYSVERDEVLAMARQLLASMEQAPVYLRPFGDDGETFVACDGDDERAITLYAAPQLPQPAVPDEAEMPSGPGVPEYNVGWANGWNSCREEMLQGAEPPAYEIKRFGDFNVRSLDLECGEMATSIQWFHFERGTVPEHVSSRGFCEKHALQAIINALQQKCDGLDDAPIPQIWPAPHQEVK